MMAREAFPRSSLPVEGCAGRVLKIGVDLSSYLEGVLELVGLQNDRAAMIWPT